MGRPSRSSRNAPAASKQLSSGVVSAVRSIDSFGRVSKRVAPSSVKKTTTTIRPDVAERLLGEKGKASHVTIELPATPSAPVTAETTSKIPTASNPAKHRKRRASEAVEEEQADSSAPEHTTRAPKRTRRTNKATASVAVLLARTNSGKAATLPYTDSDSDSLSSSLDSQAGKLIARLNLQSSFSASVSPSPPRSTSACPRPASTAPTTPCESESESETAAAKAELPLELADLIRLQAAFAKTLALHHAHHGTNAPVDIRVLCPSVAQAWGKRKVTLEDVQRCIGVLGAASGGKGANLLFLSDYGRGKICIELQPNASHNGILSDRLKDAFEANLRSRWADAHSRDAESVDTKQFIDSLPKADVTVCTSLIQASATRAKGQRSLEDLMRGIALRKQEQEAKEALLKAPAVGAPTVEHMDVDSQGQAAADVNSAPTSLLDRIRYRQLQRAQQQASGSATPTPEELERRAALHRASDIAEVLTMLCAASSSMGRQQSRVSFGMAAILTKIKDSLRLPVSRDEAASCVRLLAKEVAPQWLQIISMGGREIVIMMTDFTPSKAAIQDRVKNLC